MSNEIVLNFRLSDSKRKQKVNITSLKTFPIRKLNEVKEVLSVLNDIDIIKVNYGNKTEYEQKLIKNQLQEYLAFIGVQVRHLQAKPLNNMRKLGWKY